MQHNEPMAFGDYVAQLRALAGMTQTELAKRLALTRGYIGQLEVNSYKPSDETIDGIAEVFAVDPVGLYAAARRVPRVVKDWLTSHPDELRKLFQKAKERT